MFKTWIIIYNIHVHDVFFSTILGSEFFSAKDCMHYVKLWVETFTIFFEKEVDHLVVLEDDSAFFLRSASTNLPWI